jgi:hypothetical protein
MCSDSDPRGTYDGDGILLVSAGAFGRRMPVDAKNRTASHATKTDFDSGEPFRRDVQIAALDIVEEPATPGRNQEAAGCRLLLTVHLPTGTARRYGHPPNYGRGLTCSSNGPIGRGKRVLSDGIG